MTVSQKPRGIAESGGQDAPGVATKFNQLEEYADHDRFGTPNRDSTSPIITPRNMVADPVWGVQTPTGSPTGAGPTDPPIPVTKGN